MSTELVSDAADRAERLMPISRAAQLMGRNRNTLTEWAKKGMPIARRGETGSAHMVDLKDVILWREEQIRREERAQFPEEDGRALADCLVSECRWPTGSTSRRSG